MKLQNVNIIVRDASDNSGGTPTPSTTRAGGFTLIELLVALAVLAILLTIAVPSYRQMVEQARTDSQSGELLTTLQFARSEAVKRNSRVTVCKSSDGETCATAGDWSAGWIVFPDPVSPGTVDTGEIVLLVHAALSRSTVTSDAGVANAISFLSSGRARTGAGAMQSGDLAVCPSSGGTAGRTVTVEPGTGRPSVATSTCS